ARIAQGVGRMDEGRRIVEGALASASDQSAELWGKALAEVVAIAVRQGDYEGAVRLAREELTLARTLEGSRAFVRAALDLATAARESGDLDTAAAVTREALAVARRDGDAGGEMVAQSSLGLIELSRSNYRTALAALEDAARLAREVSSRRETVATSVFNV